MEPCTERVAKFIHWHQRNRADRLEHFCSLCSGRRLRSLFIEILQWTGIGGAQRRHSPEPAKLVGGFEPRRPVLQRKRVCRRQLSELWHADGLPAELADVRRCPRVRSK